jgi:DNA-directed RNA polymerase subunit M/transcription elongation factor TFIIS
MSSKYIKICEKCENILHTTINNTTITFKCQACQAVYPSNEDDTLLLEVHTGTLDMPKRKGESIYYNPSNPKEQIPCTADKCNVKIVKYERGKDGKKKFGCKCGNTWMINQTY